MTLPTDMPTDMSIEMPVEMATRAVVATAQGSTMVDPSVHRHRRRAVGVLVLLTVLASGCGEVGRAFTGTPPPPGPDPIAVLPTGGPPPGAGAADPTPSAPPAPTSTPPADRTARPEPSARAFPGDCDGCADRSAVEAAIAAATAPVVIALDASVAMGAALAGDGPSRLESAQDAVQRLVLGTPGYADTGVVTFGAAGDGTEGGRSESCSTVTTVSFPGDAVPEDAAVAAAVGWRPTTSMLDLVVPVLAQVGEGAGPFASVTPGRVVLVTAGTDTCGRDPLTAVEGLQDPPVVDVLALSPTPDDGRALARLAAATGGRYLATTDAVSVATAADALAARAVDDLRPALVPPPPDLAGVLGDLASQAQAARRAVLDRFGTPPPGTDVAVDTTAEGDP